MSTAAHIEPEFLTPENVTPLVEAGKIGSNDNIGWRQVSYTQLSIARYSGGAVVNGVEYEYMYGTDELVRRDVARMIRAAWRKAAKPKTKEPAQGDLLAPPKAQRKRRPSKEQTK